MLGTGRSWIGRSNPSMLVQSTCRIRLLAAEAVSVSNCVQFLSIRLERRGYGQWLQRGITPKRSQHPTRIGVVKSVK